MNRFKSISIKALAAFFSQKLIKLISQFIWKCQRTRTVKTTLKKNRVEGLTVPIGRTYYKDAVMKIV